MKIESLVDIDMKHEILSEKQNELLRRKELQLAIAHDNEPTPSRAALQELLAKQLGEEKEKIDVRSVYSDRGRARSLSKIFIWEEPPKKAEKKQEEKPEKKEETKQETQEAKAEEEKAEEKTEKRTKEKAEAKEENNMV